MAQYLVRILDYTGVMVWGNGGDYVEAATGAEARRIGEAQFLAPGPTPKDEAEAAFLTRIGAARSRIVANGYTVQARRQR